MNAVASPDARTDFHRAGVGAVLASTWRVGTPERQRAAVDAIRTTWEAREWPDLGLLGYSVAIGHDGTTLLHYSQWTSEQDYEDFVRTFRSDRNAAVNAAVPGIERVELRRFAPPHRTVAPAGDGGIAARFHRSTQGGPDLVVTEHDAALAVDGGSGVRWYTPALSLGAGV